MFILSSLTESLTCFLRNFPRLMHLLLGIYSNCPQVFNNFRPCIVLKWRSVIFYLGIPLIVRYAVSKLRFVLSLVLKLAGRCISLQLYRTSGNEFSVVLILQLILLALRLRKKFSASFKKLASKAFGRIVSRFVFAIRVFLVPSNSHQLVLYYLDPSRSVLDSVLLLFLSLIR